MKYYECSDLNKETNLLDGHRRQLLGDLHAVQKQIDCLDYLVYELKKENIKETIIKTQDADKSSFATGRFEIIEERWYE